jgi:hypothetical protein
VLSGDTLCLLAPADEGGAAGDDWPVPLGMRVYGQNGDAPGRVRDAVLAWDRARRPGSDRLRLRAEPLSKAAVPAPGELIIDKHWTRLVANWS